MQIPLGHYNELLRALVEVAIDRHGGFQLGLAFRDESLSFKNLLSDQVTRTMALEASGLDGMNVAH